MSLRANIKPVPVCAAFSTATVSYNTHASGSIGFCLGECQPGEESGGGSVTEDVAVFQEEPASLEISGHCGDLVRRHHASLLGGSRSNSGCNVYGIPNISLSVFYGLVQKMGIVGNGKGV